MTDTQHVHDAFPTRKGFRLRGLAMTRIEVFTDAAFAFALTLLVLASDVPSDYAGLLGALEQIPAFVFSASLLMMFWAAHHTWSRRYGLDDVPTILLSCLLVFTVLIYVYPLRFMFGSMTSWLFYLLGVPMSSEPIRMRLVEYNHMFVIYGVGFIAMTGTIVLLNIHAWRLREELELNDLERFDTKSEMQMWSVVGAAGCVSILLALLTPPSMIGLPGWAYSLLAIVMPVLGNRVEKKRQRLTDG
jgi:uncharacterized membrane protein